MTAPILVTGASGNVGSEIVRLLRRHGQPVRVAARDETPEGDRDGVEAVRFDFADKRTYAGAFVGVERMFLLRPPAISDVRRVIAPAIDAARDAGVRHIVFLSLLGVQRNPVVPHHAIEQHILRSGLDYTFLRASFFMQNLSTTHRQEIADEDIIAVPAGRGRTSFVDVRDIAAVGALALTEEGHANHAYDLTGGEALNYYEVAGLFSEVLGRPIIYRDPSLVAFIRRERARGTELSKVLVMAGIYTTARLGLAGRISDDVERLLGRAPTTMRQFIQDYRAYWERDGAA
jgi:uncharacterized protein YbjT (DUF2867 family)